MFIKSFSKGQITIPKDIRELLGIADEFWLKLQVQGGKIIAEPIEKNTTNEAYRKKLLAIKGGWFTQKEYKETRKELKERSEKLNW